MTTLNAQQAITPTPLAIHAHYARGDYQMKTLLDMEKRFRQDTIDHKMYILRDEGLYRHLRFSDTPFYGFDIITWPRHLTITGGMGTWTFCRQDDMLTDFFTSDYVNLSYWSEKLISGDPHIGIKDFSEEKFRDVALRGFWNWSRQTPNAQRVADLWEEVRYLVFGTRVDALHPYWSGPEDVWDDSSARILFERIRNEYGIDLDHYGDEELVEETPQLLWSLHAVLWAAQNYRALRD